MLKNCFFGLAVSVITSVSLAHAEVGDLRLGKATSYRRLVKRDHCRDLLSRTSFAAQLSFTRDFLLYDRQDTRAGLANAILTFFPRAEVLFSDEPVDGGQVNRNSLSYRMRASGHREADRTLTSIVLLQKIMRGEGPPAFETPVTPLNPGLTEITRIRQIVFDFLTGQSNVDLDQTVFAKVKLEKLHALIVRLIIHDQGKFERFLSEYKNRLANEGLDLSQLSADHDVAMADIMTRYPFEMMPSVTTVLPGPRAHMVKSDIGAFNPGRVFQFEAPARHLMPLARLKKEPFQFSIIKEILDVGGSRGAEFPEGSFWIKPVISTYFRLYDDYYAGRIGAHPRRLKSYYGETLRSAAAELRLPAATERDLALVRLARLFRLNQFPPGARERRVEVLARLFSQLEAAASEDLIKELNRSGIDDGWALTFGYVPQIAENIQVASGVWIKKDPAEEQAVTDSQIEKALAVTLATLVRAVRLSRVSLQGRLTGSGEFTLEMPQVADYIKKNGVEALESGELVFSAAGKDSAEIRVRSF